MTSFDHFLQLLQLQNYSSELDLLWQQAKRHEDFFFQIKLILDSSQQ